MLFNTKRLGWMLAILLGAGMSFWTARAIHAHTIADTSSASFEQGVGTGKTGNGFRAARGLELKQYDIT